MRPILFSIGSVNFYSFGFFLAVGFVLGIILLFFLAQKSGQITNAKDRSQFLDLILYSVLAGLVCGRIGHIVAFSAQYRGVPFWEAMLRGGFSFYPGLLGGLIVYLLLLKLYKKPIWNWLALAMLGLLLGKAIAHIGIWLAGQATNLYLLIWTLVGLIVIMAAIFRIGIRSFAIPAKSQFVFLFGLLWIALGNILVDFLIPNKKLIWILTLSQWISLTIVILVVLTYILKRRFGKK